MNLNLFGNQVKLLSSTADITEWFDCRGVGTSFAALLKAASTKGTVLYITMQPKHQFNHLPDSVFGGFTKVYPELKVCSKETKILFMSPSKLDCTVQRLEPSLIIFDNAGSGGAYYRNAKVLVVGTGVEHHFYRETYLSKRNNPYLT